MRARITTNKPSQAQLTILRLERRRPDGAIKMSTLYSKSAYASMLKWRNKSKKNYRKWLDTVTKAKKAAKEKAIALLGGRCAEPGCKSTKLEFHHIYGDGKQHRLDTRDQIYNWALKNPEAAKKTLELRCHADHLHADRLLGLRGPKKQMEAAVIEMQKNFALPVAA
jgi:hypothetical protein